MKTQQKIILFLFIVFFSSLKMYSQSAEDFESICCKDTIFEVNKIYNSHNKLFQMKFQSNGDLVLLHSDQVIWSSNTKSLNAKKCMFKSSEGLILFDSNQKIVWQPVPHVQEGYYNFLINHFNGNLELRHVMIINNNYTFPQITQLWSSNSNFEPKFVYGEKCGCNDAGQQLTVVNSSQVKWEVTVETNATLHGKFFLLNTKTYLIGPGGNMYLGCNWNYCTKLEPKGYRINYKIIKKTFLK